MTLARRARRLLAAAASVTLVAGLAACTPEAEPTIPVPSPTKPVELTVGVFGSAEEIGGFREIVKSFNTDAVSARARLVTWPDREAMMADVEAGERLPDLYLVSRDDLAEIRDRQLNQPVFELLDARGIAYGDEFSPSAIGAFSADDNLQCMPYSASPMVMYYNTDLVDFDRMRARGLPAPEPDAMGWDLEEFAAAAAFASRPRRNTKGVSVEPTLASLAPFVYSGGGRLFDDDENPTSLSLSDEESRDALTRSLEILRDPTLTLSEAQLARRDPVEWFKRGRLGMIEGFRDLTPELREVPGLDFDVISMPRLDEFATAGDITGLCLSPGAFVNKKADFLVHAISDESFSTLAETGYVVPVKTSVARSEAFLQSGREPEDAAVFNASVDTIALAPFTERYADLTATVEPLIRELFTTPVLEGVDELTEEIDEVSRSVLDPTYTPAPGEPSPSTSSPSESPSDGVEDPGSP